MASKFVFRMSGSGYCAKRLSARLVGTASKAAPPWLVSSAEEGKWHETRMKDEMRALGCEITDEQIELRMSFPGFDLTGHPDGRIHVTGQLLDSPAWKVVFLDLKRSEVDFSQRMLLECKSFSFLEHQRWMKGMFEEFPQYGAQITCYDRAMSNPIAAYAVKDRSSGARTLYIMRSAQASLPEIIEKLQLVATFASRGQLAPREFDPFSIECLRFCEFRETLCSAVSTVVDDRALEEAALNYLVGRHQEKEGKARAEEARDMWLSYAKQSKKSSPWLIGPYRVYYSSYPREDVSIRRLEAIMPRETFERAISVSQIERIRIIDTEAREDNDE